MILKEHISVVAVTDPSTGGPLGIFTTGDYLRRIAAPELCAHATSLGSVMTPIAKTAYAFEENTTDDALEILAAVGAHHIPVMSDVPEAGGEILGILSQDELLGLTRAVREARSRKLGDQTGLRYFGGSAWGGGDIDDGDFKHAQDKPKSGHAAAELR